MDILLIGAGKMARGVVFDLLLNDEVNKITVLDCDKSALASLKDRFDNPRIETACVNIEKIASVAPYLKGINCVINATHYRFNYALSELCINHKTNFCDMGGNVEMVEKQLTLNGRAKENGVTVIPDCGLAPGMANIVSAYYLDEFDEADSLKIRVGGVPQKPKTLLNYQLVFSVEGLINEYLEKAIILKDGVETIVDSMTETEDLLFNDPFGRMEAFYTSGGTSTLPKTLKGKVKNLDYKTIRYPGHSRLIKFLLEIGLASSDPMELNGNKIVPRKMLGKLFENYLPQGEPDAVLIRIEITGKKLGNVVKETYELIDKYDEKNDLSSMQRTTAFPVSIIAQMLGGGKISKKGVIPQELCIPKPEFMQELEKRSIKFAKV